MEHVLQATPHRRVVRVGDTIRRPVYPWSSSIHGLLRHLESVGFPHSPRFLGMDDLGREVLSFIEGVAGGDGYVEGVEFGAHAWAMVVSDAGLGRFARLLRDYHLAVRDYRPPDDAAWATGSGPPAAGEVICHNDFGPWNLVWRDEHPLGIIDWDYAAPGPSIGDVAHALEWSVPFCPDDDCLKWRRFCSPPDRPHRIAVFADAYGLASTEGLVDAVLRRQQAFKARGKALAARGIQPAVDEVASGYLEIVESRIRWTEEHRHDLE
jgi:hypothetical protein